MMVDDAHSSGVLGNRGRGTVDHLGCHGRVDIQVGTLSKAIGSIGGYVCGSRDLIDFLYHRAPPVPFLHIASALSRCHVPGSLQLLDSEAGERLIKKLWSNTKFFKRKLKKLGFSTGKSETPITPIMVGDAGKAFQFAQELFQEGVFAGAIGYPTVPEGKARLRTIVTATHKRADLECALEILERVGKKLAII